MNTYIKQLLEVEPDVAYLQSIFREITYSPEDNKLRLYPNFRFSSEIWKILKSAGMSWAPKQELFVMVHNINREDLCLFLLPEGEEIQPEGTTLAERAEIKAARLEGYYAHRVADMGYYARAASAYSANSGQPVLSGHHSAKKAETAAKRAKTATRNSLDHERRANYWSWKIDGVAHYANRRANPGVRMRRIDTLLKQLRDTQRVLDRYRSAYNRYCNIMDFEDDEAFNTAIERFSDYKTRQKIEGGEYTHEGVYGVFMARAVKDLNHDYVPRQAMHLLNRIVYENSLLPKPDLFPCEKLTPAILKKFLVKHGCPSSPKEIKVTKDRKEQKLTVTLQRYNVPAHLGSGKTVTMTAAGWCVVMRDLGYNVPAPKPKPPALLNMEATGWIKLRTKYTGFSGKPNFETVMFKHMTKAEFAAVWHEYKGTFFTEDGKYRVRICKDTEGEGWRAPWVAVFLTDQKSHPVPESVEILEEQTEEAESC